VQIGANGDVTASVAVAVNVTNAPEGPVASTVEVAGTATIGAVVSATVTLKDADPVLPPMSVALHVTDVVPRGNVDPEAGMQLVGSDPSTMS
jgi:hypothetical protein